MISKLEQQFALKAKLLGLPDPERELKFHPTRKWRFDFAWPAVKIAVEIEGGNFSRGKSRHTTGKGYEQDCEKYNAAAALGWIVFRLTGDMVKDHRGTDLLLIIKDTLEANQK